MNPRRKARKEEQLTGELSGDLATTEEQLLKVLDLLQKISERNHEPPDDAAAGISPIVY